MDNNSRGIIAGLRVLRSLPVGIGLMLAVAAASAQEQSGLTDTVIRVGGVMDLEGDSKGLGQGMKAGLEAAFTSQRVGNRKIELIVLNDFYNPPTTSTATQQLVDQGIFAMIGNVGTPTAAVSLPILAKNKIPAVGFFTGAGLLRPGDGNIVNYRASYVQETTAVIGAALAAGMQPEEICAYVQNDAYGMAGVAGIKAAFSEVTGAESLIASLDEVMAKTGDNPERNHIGPVGVYVRNTLQSREGYKSLKDWEAFGGSPCRLVVTVGTYTAIGRFIAYAEQKGEDWRYSAVSFTGAEKLRETLSEYGVSDGVVVTQVVPELNSPRPIVAEARRALEDDLSYVSLEGFIVGKMFLRILEDVAEPVTRQGFLVAARGSSFELEGVALDFTDDNQGSNLVSFIYLDGGQFAPIDSGGLTALFR